jgi:amino acid adenylation domain-containing protein
MDNIEIMFYEFRINEGAIWLHNETIQFSIPKKFQNEETKNFLVNNKGKIASILNENQIFSKEKFLDTEIFKDSTLTHYPLSPSQERLWFIEQFEEGTNAFNLYEVYELETDTDKEGIKYALQKIVARHEVLRSTIEQRENQNSSVQVVHNDSLFIEEIVVSDLEDCRNLIKEEIKQPFKLNVAYPIRIKLYNIKSSSDDSLNKTLLVITTHHIASDGWSKNIFHKEFRAYYEAYINNNITFNLPDLEIQYKDYSLWQRSYLTGEILEKQLSYWKEKLSGYQTLEFPKDYTRPASIDYKGESQGFTINKEVSKKLRGLAQQCGATLNSVMLSSMNILFSKYTNQDDIVIGSPVANRHHHQTEELIGFFVNTQVNRTLLNKNQSFKELIEQVHQNQIDAQLHLDLPFEKLVDELGGERNTSIHPIFQVLFAVQSFEGQGKTISQEKNFLNPYEIENVDEVEKLDISIYINDSEEELTGILSYAKSLFKDETIERLLSHFINLLEQLTKTPEKPYSQINLLSDKELHQLVYDWNATNKAYEKAKSVIDLFEEQVVRTPNYNAIVFGEKELTYQQLNEESDKLASYLIETYDTQRNDLIGIMLDRSEMTIIAILGILKAGAAYVCIDPEYPLNRKEHIIEDTSLKILITQVDYIFDLDFYNGNLFSIDVQLDAISISDQLPKKDIQPNDLAYVIYTSGTTGKPKGVELTHGNLNNLTFNIIEAFDIDQQTISSQIISTSFDGAVSEIYPTLIAGGTLHIISEEIKQNGNLLKHIASEKITHLTVPADLLESFEYLALNKLKTIHVGGGVNSVACLNRWSNGRKLINAYGPTEGTVYTTMHQYREGDLNTKIGKPISNTNAYVLDSNNAPVPVGVIGELHIGGASLSRGYLNRPDLTAERFVNNLFATEADKAKGYTKLYKTGDLVRWLSDGNLEYIGRGDDQVKIRGYRIELGEIEYAMSQIEGIKQVSVLAKERKTETTTTKYLVGYYVLDAGELTIDQASIMDKLSQVLPDYMVPTALVAMESFPLTINGKLDKGGLPDPEFNTVIDYVKPETELEIKLCVIYSEVLGLSSDQVSIHQNFFKMGGNSILSLQLKQKLNQLDEFREITIADLFEYNSIIKLIQSIRPTTLSKYQLQTSRVESTTHEIAIISTSGAFSGAENTTEFWQLIANQQEGIQLFSKEECLQRGVDESLLEMPNFVPVLGQVEGIENFDPIFWGISPNEAKQTNPQIRKFIEHSWFVLESSGYSQERKKHNIGVFAGSGNSDYFYDHILNGEKADQINLWEAAAANSKDALATKTAFFLGLSGPATSINTACSTGLVSVVEACKNLQLGFCDMALAGGVSFGAPDGIGYLYEEGMISSKDGHCRTFDGQASGTIGTSGVGVVLLKRLEDAIKDGDTILGVIKGYATNNDGDRKTSYTAPSLIGQSECIINAQRMAGVSSNEIDYVECHGTATHLGDPIEVQALREAFAFNEDKEKALGRKTVLGAVKANIGHADSAAGTASLIKVCAMLQHNILPGQVNFESPNPELGLEQTNFEILKQNRDWLSNDGKQRLAGVSSFGVGGTNAHVIIGDYVAPTKEMQETTIAEEYHSIKYIIPVSAKSGPSLEQNKTALLNYLRGIQNTQQSVTIRDIAYSLQEKKEQFQYRSAYCAQTIDDLIAGLKENTITTEVTTESNAKTVFMFPGQGAQYINMAKVLYENEPVFKTAIDKCISIANQHLEVDLYQVMYPNAGDLYDINQTQWSQITLFIIEYGLSEYLTHLGVKADAYIGHSIGEYVAATLSEVFSLEDAIKIVISRGQLMQSMESGSMLAIHSAEIDIQEIVKECHCEIAVINSLENIVVSGSHDKIQSLKTALENRGIISIKLNVSHAYHSVMMEGVLDKFEKVFSDVKLNTPKKKFISNLTGVFAAAEVTSAKYWCNQLRNTVQFAEGINTLSKEFNHQVSFIEVGPGRGLGSFINTYKKLNNYKYLQSVQLLCSAKEAQENVENGLLNKEQLIAKLWMNGVIEKPNELQFFKQAKLLSNLPVYQFDSQKYWLERGKEIKSQDELALLPKEKWLSAPVWSAVSSFKVNKVIKSVAKKALIFIREDQMDIFDFQSLCEEIQFVIIDSNLNQIDYSETIKINSENEDHFKNLGSYFKTKQITFDMIIHCCSIDNTSQSDDKLSNSLYSLFLIRQYLLNSNGFKKLVVLTNGLTQITSEDSINPFNGTLVGAIRNINHEFINLDARTIDIGYNYSNVESSISQVVSNEAYKKSDELLAIRFGKLWIERFEKIDNSLEEERIIEDGDVILITGGLGGVALSVAKYISEKNRVKFILVSRRNIYDEQNPSNYVRSKFKIIEEIIANNSSVDIQCLDISNSQQVETVIKNMQNVYGSIKGIIHTAGVKPLDIEEYNLTNIKNVLGGKVYGINNILNVIDLTSTKFIAFTSSLSSVMGDINRLEYCAANSYLDYLAMDKKNFKNINTLAVNWPGWSDTGMVREDTISSIETIKPLTGLSNLLHLNTIKQNEGAELFYRLINQTSYEQVVVSKLDVHTLKSTLFNQNEIPSDNQQIKIIEDDYSEKEFQVAIIFANILGLEQISLHDDFFKLGGNSILATQFSHRMSAKFDADVKIADIFRFKNCKTLAENIQVLEIASENVQMEF